MSEIIPGGGLQRNHAGGLIYYSFPAFPAAHGFFGRVGGVSEPPYHALNTAYKTGDSRSRENRRILIETLELQDYPLYVLNPCNGDHIAHIASPDTGLNGETVLINTEGAFTNIQNVNLLISSADCIILLITDHEASFIGVAHLGWRNLVSGFAEKVIHESTARYQKTPSSLKIAISPCIYPCCYIFESPSQLHDPFWRPYLKRRDAGGYAIDLASALKSQIQSLGVNPSNIFECGLCTACNRNLFFSAYRDGYVTGRFPTLTGLRAGALARTE